MGLRVAVGVREEIRQREVRRMRLWDRADDQRHPCERVPTCLLPYCIITFFV